MMGKVREDTRGRDLRWHQAEPKLGGTEVHGHRGGGGKWEGAPGKNFDVTLSGTKVGRNQSSESWGHTGKGEKRAPRKLGGRIEGTPRRHLAGAGRGGVRGDGRGGDTRGT